MRVGTALKALPPQVEVPGVSVVQARILRQAQELRRRARLVMRDDTASQALRLRMAVLEDGAAQARTPQRAQAIRRRACLVVQDDTASQALPRIKDPGLVLPEVSQPALPILPRALLVRLGLTRSLDKAVASLAHYSNCKTS